MNDAANGKKGAITFLDVLGWKGVWQRKPDAIDILSKIIEESKNCEQIVKDMGYSKSYGNDSFNDIDVNILSISDTIVITTFGECERTLEFHACMCFMILVESIEKGLPVRGATNYGYFDIRGNILVGPAIDEVASWYEAADWIGVIQTPSAYFMSDYNCEEDTIMIEYEVPLKGGGKIHTRCVNWPFLWLEEGNSKRDLENAFIKMGPVTPEIYPKFKNTLEFYKVAESIRNT